MIEYLNQCIDDDLIKKTKLIKTNKYCMGAITTRGTNEERLFNQDYSAIVSYPYTDDIVMLIAADGKYDSEDGKTAAFELVHALSEWFLSKSLGEFYINTPVLLEGKLFGELRKLNRKLYDDKSVGDTSFALAIIGKEDTLIANIGNVRCYSVNNDDITLQTRDDLIWYLYNSSDLITADEVKYLIGKDYISQTIGKADNSKRLFHPFINIISNDDYDSLLLTTHGVNDVLDSDELFDFVCENDVSDVLLNIINASIFAKSKSCSDDLLSRHEKMANMLIERTIPGDSNASAIVYKKTKNS